VTKIGLRVPAKAEFDQDACESNFYGTVTGIDDLKTEHGIEWTHIRLPVLVMRNTISVKPSDPTSEIQYPVPVETLSLDPNPAGMLDIPVV
jgi:hypothetical protein